MSKSPNFLPLAICLLLAAAPAWCAEATNKLGNAFLDTVAANFSNWDTNHDRTLSVAELDAAIENPANRGGGGGRAGHAPARQSLQQRPAAELGQYPQAGR